MARLFVNISSDQLSLAQEHLIREAHFKVIGLPQELKNVWENVHPFADLASVSRKVAVPIATFIQDVRDQERATDVVVLIHGEPTATVALLDALSGSYDFIPVVATTCWETKMGKPARRHVRFRGYKPWADSRLKELGLC